MAGPKTRRSADEFAANCRHTRPQTTGETRRSGTTIAALPKQDRLFFIDNLRVFLVMLVMAVHVAIAYGGSGQWSYKEPTTDVVTMALLAMFNAVSQSFFMGLLFMIAGYFTPSFYDRKGARRFLVDRFLRLGIPLVVYVALIDPIIGYEKATRSGLTHRAFPAFWSQNPVRLQLGSGPLWFVQTLLMFSMVYAAARSLSTRSRTPGQTAGEAPSNVTVLLVAGDERRGLASARQVRHCRTHSRGALLPSQPLRCSRVAVDREDYVGGVETAGAAEVDGTVEPTRHLQDVWRIGRTGLSLCANAGIRLVFGGRPMAVVTGDRLEVIIADEQLLLNGRWRAFVESAAGLEDWRGYMDLEHDDERALSLPEAGTLEGIFHADDGKEYKGWFSVSIRLDSVGHHLKLQGLGTFHGMSPRPHY